MQQPAPSTTRTRARDSVASRFFVALIASLGLILGASLVRAAVPGGDGPWVDLSAVRSGQPSHLELCDSAAVAFAYAPCRARSPLAFPRT